MAVAESSFTSITSQELQLLLLVVLLTNSAWHDNDVAVGVRVPEMVMHPGNSARDLAHGFVLGETQRDLNDKAAMRPA